MRVWFGGFTRRSTRQDRRAMPPQPPVPAWWRVLGFDAGPPSTLGLAEAHFRRLAASAHPDRGGSVDAMQRLNWARAEARRRLGSVP